jgi:hypothetical protein
MTSDNNANSDFYKTKAVWAGAIGRCHNPKDSAYRSYGGRGIYVCERWRESFECFLEDMGYKPEGLSLERLKNDGPYSLDNCVWADRVTQGNNKRNNVWLEYGGVWRPQGAWAHEYHGKWVDLVARLQNGWTMEQALGVTTAPNLRKARLRIIRRPNFFRSLVYKGENKLLSTWAKERGIKGGILRLRLDKLGWTAGQALEFEAKPADMRLQRYQYGGKTHTRKEWSRVRNIDEAVLRWRLANWPIGEALGFKKHKSERSPPIRAPRLPPVHYGDREQSIGVWARERGINIATLKARLKKGWPIDEALNFAPRSPSRLKRQIGNDIVHNQPVRVRESRSKHAEYQAWYDAKRRCCDPNSIDYPQYGGRGITMCRRWQHSFDAFFDDMGRRPSKKHSLDRRNPNEGYSKINCRWVLRYVQANNKTTTRQVLYHGNQVPIQDLCRSLGLNAAKVADRIRHGWSVEEALGLEPRIRQKRKVQNFVQNQQRRT